MNERLPRRRGLLCVVTARHRLCPGGTLDDQCRALQRQARVAADAGVDLFQVRERDLPDQRLLALVRTLKQETAGTAMQVLVNDRVDVALGAGLDGVHLPADGLSIEDARGLLGEAVVGKSTHAAEEAAAASAAGADYVLLGTVFPSASKPAAHRVIGVEELARAARAASVPVLAIGGVTAATVHEVARVAAGVAAIGWFATLDERAMRQAARAARAAFDSTEPLI